MTMIIDHNTINNNKNNSNKKNTGTLQTTMFT